MGEEEEELEVLGFHWGRYTWTLMSGLAWFIVLTGWTYYPIPGYDRDLWWVIGTGLQALILYTYAGPFSIILGTKRIQLGSSALLTVNEDAFKPKTIPWHDVHGNPICTMTVEEDGREYEEELKLKKGRVGGIPFLNIKGKDWAVWLDFPGANVDEGAVRKIRVNLQPTPLAELPYCVRSDFVAGGAVIQPGYNPKRSRIFFGLEPMTEEPVPAINVRMDAGLRAANRMIEKLEMELRRMKGLGEREEAPLVRIVRESEERRREGLAE